MQANDQKTSPYFGDQFVEKCNIGASIREKKFHLTVA